MGDWVATRQSVLVAVFLAYFANFCCQWIARKSNDQQISDRIRQIHTKVFLFGLISLVSCNLLQGGIFQAVTAWIVLILLLVMHGLSFRNIQPKIRAITPVLFHLVIFIQSLGTLVQFLL